MGTLQFNHLKLNTSTPTYIYKNTSRGEVQLFWHSTEDYSNQNSPILPPNGIFLFYSCYILDVITCMISIVYLNNGYLIVDLDILDETYSTYRYFDILLSLQISQCVLENKFIKCVVEVMLIQNRSFWNTAMLTFGTSFIIIRYIP